MAFLFARKLIVAAFGSLFLLVAGCGNAGNAVKTANDAAGFAGDRGVGDTRDEITTQSIQVDSAGKTMHVHLGSAGTPGRENRGTFLVRPRSGGVRNNIMSFTVPLGWTVHVLGPNSPTWHGQIAIQPFPANTPTTPARVGAGRAIPYSNVTGTRFVANIPGDYAIVATGQGQNNRILEVFTVSPKIQVPGISNNPFQRYTGRD